MIPQRPTSSPVQGFQVQKLVIRYPTDIFFLGLFFVLVHGCLMNNVL